MSDIPSKDAIDSLLQKVKKADASLHDALAMAETVVTQQKEFTSIRAKLTSTEERVCILTQRLYQSEHDMTKQNQELRALKKENQELAKINETEKQKCMEYDKCFRDLQCSNEEITKYKDSKIQYLENNRTQLEHKIESLEKILGDQNSKIRETTELRIELDKMRRNQLSQAKHFAEGDTETNEGGSEGCFRVASPRNALKEKFEEMKKRCEKAEQSVQNKDQELERHKSGNEMKEKQIKELQRSIAELEVELKKTYARADKTMKETGKVGISNKNTYVAAFQRKMAQLETQLTIIEAEKQKVDQENMKLKCEKDDMKKENDLDLAKKVNEIRNLEKEKSDLLLRLSKMAGRRLTDNKPDMADLSDVSRPTKLAEQYAELYDNEWTDAYSYLDTLDEYKGSELSVIAALLAMLSTAYKVSLKTAEKQLQELRNILNVFHGNTTKQDQHMKDVLNQLKDVRKRAVQPRKELREEYIKEIRKAFPKLDSSSLECDALKIYLQKCLELCWLMVIQDPPVHLNCIGCKKGDPFDKTIFKEYTQAGPFIEFTVWPAVFLEKGGALLCKGIVQCDKRLSGFLRGQAKTVLFVPLRASSVQASREQSFSLQPARKMDFGDSDEKRRVAVTVTDKRYSKQQSAQTTENADTKENHTQCLSEKL